MPARRQATARAPLTGARRFAAALTGAIKDPVIRQLPPIGGADQFIDNTDALGDLRYPRAVITTHEGKPG